jgi:hypothetical protein
MTKRTILELSDHDEEKEIILLDQFLSSPE